MFETLDANVLQQMAKLDDRLDSSATMPLTQIMACLEMVEKECAAAYAMGCRTVGGGSYQVIESGISAAQRIVTRSLTQGI